MFIEKTFPANDEALYDVLGFVEESLESAGASMKVIMQVTVAIEEIFVNISHYAYAEQGGEGDFKLAFGLDGDMSSFTFTDWGTEFDPLAKEDPDVTLTAEERTIGGLGIFMVKQTMDDVTYEYKDGANILCLKKKIN